MNLEYLRPVDSSIRAVSKVTLWPEHRGQGLFFELPFEKNVVKQSWSSSSIRRKPSTLGCSTSMETTGAFLRRESASQSIRTQLEGELLNMFLGGQIKRRCTAESHHGCDVQVISDVHALGTWTYHKMRALCTWVNLELGTTARLEFATLTSTNLPGVDLPSRENDIHPHVFWRTHSTESHVYIVGATTTDLEWYRFSPTTKDKLHVPTRQGHVSLSRPFYDAKQFDLDKFQKVHQVRFPMFFGLCHVLFCGGDTKKKWWMEPSLEVDRDGNAWTIVDSGRQLARVSIVQDTPVVQVCEMPKTNSVNLRRVDDPFSRLALITEAHSKQVMLIRDFTSTFFYDVGRRISQALLESASSLFSAPLDATAPPQRPPTSKSGHRRARRRQQRLANDKKVCALLSRFVLALCFRCAKTCDILWCRKQKVSNHNESKRRSTLLKRHMQKSWRCCHQTRDKSCPSLSISAERLVKLP